MLGELHIASNLLQVALDRYLNACLATKRLYMEASLTSGLQDSTGPALINELSSVLTHEAKLRESKQAISRSINQSPDIVPFNKLPIDILVHIFRELVDSALAPHR